MSNVGFRVIMNIKRPPRELVEKFKEFSTPNIADNMNRFFCVASEIKMINEKKDLKMVGTALTVKTRIADNLMVHKALEIAKPGDVIVVDAAGDMNNAILGEIMVRLAMKRKLAGFLIDGCIRDSSAIRELDFPVFARGANPKGPYKDGPGEINVPISCGGVVIRPGDILVGDADGVVVVPPEEAENVLENTKKIVEKEKLMFEQIEKGTLDRSWIDKTLRERGCEIIDGVE
ncbi:MAG: Dimethylmenaquinone methyltransferase [Caldanaerobacter subterraneus]|uniref:Putative 4-hydroxy-4-methyl-2-oxoglutarate aldolase n=1 Tax=Caldanaerobacter subterraneus TaxID=911092 RepID=A0A101E2Z0_9THEO|nr:RraA family protein [Caldanaerobacter subterraneus]KUK07889.1 MAG: Dimethylmenaquinone methyltransferase [Caldanaerobacter subterraneus]MCF6097126.1 RraA family protein [Thermovorax subterraneus]HBT49772.1 methyltransferase [Caldanaerobacter subterraneus]